LGLGLYLDDSIFSHLLRRLLVEAGHTVVIPADVQLSGARDEVHFEYARSRGLILVTRNPKDFLALHERTADHAGLLLVYRDNDPTRDMTAPDILRAISNLITSGVPLAGAAHPLNPWQY
jgi:hypothetical protein